MEMGNTRFAPAEDRALRGRNLSADWSRINGRSGSAAKTSLACPCRNPFPSDKSNWVLRIERPDRNGEAKLWRATKRNVFPEG